MATMAADGNGRRRGEREARERGGGGRAATGGWARGGRTPRPTHAAKRSTRQRARRLSELRTKLGDRALKKYRSHIDASHSRQPLVKGERLVRYEMNAVMMKCLGFACCRLLQNCWWVCRPHHRRQWFCNVAARHHSALHRTKDRLLMHGIR